MPGKVELYAHDGDTEMDYDAFENVNLATNASYDHTVKELLALLEATWDNGVLPPADPPAPDDANAVHTPAPFAQN